MEDSMKVKHISVLKNEAIELLNLKSNGIYVDCTLGAGGHAAAILEHLPAGHLYGFDQDPVARKMAAERLAQFMSQLTIIPENFTHLKRALAERDVTAVDGILFDIGVSSMQLDEATRGFSYRFDAPLDMRMDTTRDLTARDVVNTYTVAELRHIFQKYGEEQFAGRIATNIVQARTVQPIETTFELIEIIRRAIPMKKQREKHPAKKVFQALRIEVNDELTVFASALEQAIELLKKNGRLAVITFHSLEDRVCKQIFNNYGKKVGPKNELEKLIKEETKMPIKILTKKPIVASEKELLANPRAKSAKLRVIEKII